MSVVEVRSAVYQHRELPPIGAIDTRHDSATGEAWLHASFTYMLYG
ncbi:MAG TPA: hypothetical protein VEU08_00600 [Vicinamibacterales bacterium]|nr:hypothetical protein [Vicinamibacterales bacterium]